MIKKLILAASLLIVANVFAFAQDEIDDGSRVKIRLFYSGGTSKYDVYYDDVVQLETGESVAFEPVDKNDGAGTGTWVWTDPDGSQNVRQVRNFVNVTIDKAGVYTIERKNNNVVVYRHRVKIYVDGKLSKDEQLATYPKNDQADAAYKAFNDAFLVTRLADNKPHGTYYKEGYNSGDAGKLYCWEQGLDVLMLMDRYRFRGDETMKPLISKVVDALNYNENDGYNSARADKGVIPAGTNKKYFDLAKKNLVSNWLWNDFNDDLLWMSLPNIRAYLITGEKRFLAQAEWTSDYMFDRGWSVAEMGGGIWWRVEDAKYDDQCKSGLSNNPAICLNAYLYEATGNEKYLHRAKLIFDWVFDVLRNDDGPVDEQIEVREQDYPRRHNSYNVYNEGAFVEGAAALYRITGEERYYEAAKQTADWVILNKVNNNGLMEFGNKTDGTWQSEFVRGIAFLLEARPELWKEIVVTKPNNTKTTYYNWLRKNADAAWNTREKDHNLSDCAWDKQTTFLPDNKHSEMWVGSVIAQQIVPEENPWKDGKFNGMSVKVPVPEEILSATPWVKDQYGWFQNSRLGIAAGQSVALRAVASISGTWEWIGPDGKKIESTTNELSFSKFAANQSGEYIATCTAKDGKKAQATFFVSVMTSEWPTITPYVTIGNGWPEQTDLDVKAGQNYTAGPQVKNGTAKEALAWHWTGPNGFEADTREIKVDKARKENAGTYTATFTDSFGRRTQLDFHLKVDGYEGEENNSDEGEESALQPSQESDNENTNTPISDIHIYNGNADAVIYDLMGRRVAPEQLQRGIYIIDNKKVIIH